MVLSSTIRSAFFVTSATAIFAGCGGGFTAPPAPTTPGALDAALGPSWMEPSAVGRRLLYVSGPGYDYHPRAAVYVYGYDNPTKLVG